MWPALLWAVASARTGAAVIGDGGAVAVVGGRDTGAGSIVVGAAVVGAGAAVVGAGVVVVGAVAGTVVAFSLDADFVVEEQAAASAITVRLTAMKIHGPFPPPCSFVNTAASRVSGLIPSTADGGGLYTRGGSCNGVV